MREIVLATLLAGIIVPATVSAQMDGGVPDGTTYTEPQPMQSDPTGRSTDPNGNMGNDGRTGRDGGVSDAATGGAEGTSGSEEHHRPAPPAQDPARTPSPYTGGGPPPP
jgi:hypothetical protein